MNSGSQERQYAVHSLNETIDYKKSDIASIKAEIERHENAIESLNRRMEDLKQHIIDLEEGIRIITDA